LDRVSPVYIKAEIGYNNGFDLFTGVCNQSALKVVLVVKLVSGMFMFERSKLVNSYIEYIN